MLNIQNICTYIYNVGPELVVKSAWVGFHGGVRVLVRVHGEKRGAERTFGRGWVKG
jgi:hypothetical protein